ncbi:hypothetical protein AUP68_12477 [Ilyonectria robusta]
MREHTLLVTSLEEYEPNREFVGRNFNAGEVVQLVLKSPSTGRWLPFEYVQMVMMHELAHCKQMNHSRAFWAVRNSYAAQMTELWSKGYTGDGVWGRGANLGSGQWESNTVLADEVLPEHLCGGTYRSRRKRKAKPTLTYQEKKERRILNKFGKNGMALGADEETKVKLERGKKVQGKPRVAGSARGRELRAAAALARFGNQKEESPPPKEEDIETESGSESEYDDEAMRPITKDAVDANGKRILDGKGQGMVKVCEDEDADDPSARNELVELRDMFRRVKRESPEAQAPAVARDVKGKGRVKQEPLDDDLDEESSQRVKAEPIDEPSGSMYQQGQQQRSRLARAYLSVLETTLRNQPQQQQTGLSGIVRVHKTRRVQCARSPIPDQHSLAPCAPMCWILRQPPRHGNAKATHAGTHFITTRATAECVGFAGRGEGMLARSK